VRAACLTTLVLLGSAGAWSAEVYRSVDADGTVSYSDRPVGENSETVTITTQRPATAPPRGIASAATDTQATAADPTDELISEEQREPTPEERAAERERNCGIARGRLERYINSRRLYRTAADGERAYLSDEEIDEARARAAADVEEWCD
jgi:hypothetical protein